MNDIKTTSDVRSAVFRYHHDAEITLERFPAILAMAREIGPEDFIGSLNDQMVRIINTAGPRGYCIRIKWDPATAVLNVHVSERHSVLHLLARLFWAPLHYLKGGAPWKLRITAILPLDIIVVMAMDRVAKMQP